MNYRYQEFSLSASIGASPQRGVVGRRARAKCGSKIIPHPDSMRKLMLFRA